jgi:hypothetical protein
MAIVISGSLRTELPLEELDVTNPRRKCFNLESQPGAGLLEFNEEISWEEW